MSQKLFISLLILVKSGMLFAQPSEKPLFIFKQHTAGISALAFSDNSKQLLTGSEDKTAILWDLTTQQAVASFKDHIATVQAVGFSANGQQIYTGGDKVIYIWKPDGSFVSSFGGNATYIWSFCASADKKILVAGSYDMYPRVWNIEKPAKWIKALQGGHSKNALAVSVSPDSKYIATGSLDKTVVVWSTDSFKALFTYKGHTGNIFDVQWFADSKHLISASDDRTLFIWELGMQHSVHQLKGHQAAVMKVAVSPDNRFILSASADKTINFWETRTGKRIYTYSVNDMPVNTVTISNNAQYFAAGTSDKGVYVYNFTPLWVVDYYYADSITNRTKSAEIFAPRAKDEKKDVYELRQNKAKQQLYDWYNEFYDKYLAINGNVFNIK